MLYHITIYPTPTLTLPLKRREFDCIPPPSRGRLGGGWGENEAAYINVTK